MFFFLNLILTSSEIEIEFRPGLLGGENLSAKFLLSNKNILGKELSDFVKEFSKMICPWPEDYSVDMSDISKRYGFGKDSSYSDGEKFRSDLAEDPVPFDIPIVSKHFLPVMIIKYDKKILNAKEVAVLKLMLSFERYQVEKEKILKEKTAYEELLQSTKCWITFGLRDPKRETICFLKVVKFFESKDSENCDFMTAFKKFVIFFGQDDKSFDKHLKKLESVKDEEIFTLHEIIKLGLSGFKANKIDETYITENEKMFLDYLH